MTTATTKTYRILRYTQAHFRGSGSTERARIHVWNPETKTTLCGLHIDYLRANDQPKPAPEWALKESPRCARCETAQRKRLASGGDRAAAGLDLAEAINAVGNAGDAELRARSVARSLKAFRRLARALHANGMSVNEICETANNAALDTRAVGTPGPRKLAERFPIHRQG